MSNRVTIQQQTITIRHSGGQQKIVAIFDNHGEGNIDLDEYCDNFYDDELELFRAILDRISEGGESSYIVGVIDYIYEHSTGAYIEGTWHDWEELEPIFDKAQYYGEK